MHIHPILSALRRSPTGAILVALQIALALAITVNSLYIIVQRIELIGRDPGLDVANTFIVGIAPVGATFNGEAAMREDMQLLRSLPGVVAATTINAVPLSGGGSSTRYFTEPGEKGKTSDVNYFEVDEHGLETLDVKLTEGRNFDASIVTQRDRNSSAFVPEIILSKVVGKELFPGESALGKTVYDGLGQPARVVGIVEHMHGSWPSWDKVDHTAFHPVVADEQQVRYLVRARPGQRDEVMKLAEERLGAIDNGRIVSKVRSLEYVAASTYADDRAMAVYLGVVIVLLLGDRDTRHLRPGRVQRQHAHQADRDAACRGCPPLRHRALLHGRELARHHGGRRRRLRAGAAARLLAQHDVRTPAPEALLSGGRGGGALGRGTHGGARARPARGAGFPGRRDAHGVTEQRPPDARTNDPRHRRQRGGAHRARRAAVRSRALRVESRVVAARRASSAWLAAASTSSSRT